MPLRYFKLTEVVEEDPAPGEFRLATAALLTCAICYDTIAGMGGPSKGAICVTCGDIILNGGHIREHVQ